MIRWIREWVLITLGAMVSTFGVFFFLMPSHLAVGSVTGLAVVLSEFTALEVSLITLVLNVALLIAGLILIGRDFGFKTIYTSLLLPLTCSGSETPCLWRSGRERRSPR